MKFYNIIFTLLTATFILTSCSSEKEKELAKIGKNNNVDLQYPVTGKDERRLKRGRIALGGASIFNGGVEEDTSGTVKGGVNSYLWQASLEVLSFMPLSSADAVGGVIITDWYQDPAAKGERIKANVLITSKELRASGVKVSLFKQRGSGNNWVNTKATREAEVKLEDKILTRARELRLQGDTI